MRRARRWGRSTSSFPASAKHSANSCRHSRPEPPPRDVSGTDVGPVARYPGLARSHWHRDGREITVRYEGRADYAAVLDHYVRGFAAQGYTPEPAIRAPEGERHEYLKDADRVGFVLAQGCPKGKVKATIVTVLP
jgi:hypothetical protein